MRIPFAIQSYKHPSLPISAQRCVNMYAEQQKPGAKSDVTVHGVPGISTFATCGAGPIRGGTIMDNVLYVLSGGTLYSVTSGGVATPLGGVVSGSGKVGMANNGTQIIIVNGSNGYIYSSSSGFQYVSSGNFHAASTAVYSDGFFILERSGTNEFFISDSLDGTTYSNYFALAQTYSDDILAVFNHSERIYLFGRESTEVWVITGDANFPYQRVKGAGFKRGIIGTYAVTTDDESIYFIGDDRVVYKIGAGPVSTPAITQAWRNYTTVSDAIAFSYNFAGHKFVAFTFPTQNVTWELDTITGLWHERESWDQNNTSLGRWRVSCAFGIYDKVLVGDGFSAKIGSLDATVFTEFSNTIRAEVVSPPLHGNGARMFMPWFELDIETGVGLTSGQGSDPQIMLAISDDGGRTFGDQEIWRSMGAIGAYHNRHQLRWDRLGSFYDRSLKVTISDPVRRTIIAARAPGMRAGAAA